MTTKQSTRTQTKKVPPTKAKALAALAALVGLMGCGETTFSAAGPDAVADPPDAAPDAVGEDAGHKVGKPPPHEDAGAALDAPLFADVLTQDGATWACSPEDEDSCLCNFWVYTTPTPVNACGSSSPGCCVFMSDLTSPACECWYGVSHADQCQEALENFGTPIPGRTAVVSCPP